MDRWQLYLSNLVLFPDLQVVTKCRTLPVEIGVSDRHDGDVYKTDVLHIARAKGGTPLKPRLRYHAVANAIGDKIMNESLTNHETTSANADIPTANHFTGLLRLQAVCNLVGLGKSAIWYKLKEDSPYYDADFPKPIRIGKKAIAWDKNEVIAWVARRREKNL